MPIRPSSHRRILHEEGGSNGSSRSASRVRTPRVDGEENGTLDVNFSSIEELLTSKLESLQRYLETLSNLNDVAALEQHRADDLKQKAADDFNKAQIQSRLTTINEIIVSLYKPRTEVSSRSRELLLAQLYKLIVSKALIVYNEEHAGTSNYVSEEMAQRLIQLFVNGEYRSSSEFLLLYRSCVALLASDIEEFGELVSSDFLSSIKAIILNTTSSTSELENKANLVTGFAGILTILHNNSSSYGIDDTINWSMELAEGYNLSANALLEELKSGDREYSTFLDESDDKRIVGESTKKAEVEASVAVSLLHAIGCLLTLLERGQYLNEFIKDLMTKLSIIVDNAIVAISKAAGRVIALCYELYTYDNDDSDEDDEEEFNFNSPYYEQEELFAILERLANVSTHKISKKSKAETHSIFRDVLATATTYTDRAKRIEMLKRSPEGLEIVNSLMDSTYVKLSKTKSLPINSWYLYFRLIHLKWCFSFGVHNQLVSNTSIRELLKEPPTVYQAKYGYDDTFHDGNYDVSFNLGSTENKHALDDKKRTEIIRKARVNKLTEKVDDLSIT